MGTMLGFGRSRYALEDASSSGRTMATFSPALAQAPYTAKLFGASRVVSRPFAAHAPFLDFVVGWGEKPSALAARSYASRFGVPFVRGEDGFIRSLGLGGSGDPACSVVLDDRGIYYDATNVSRIENWLNTSEFVVGAAEQDRARMCIHRIRRHRLTKYNHTVAEPNLPTVPRPYVLVVDQTVGDLSVQLGLVPEQAFRGMLSVALEEHPSAEVLVKTHPEVIAGYKQGYLSGIESGGRVQLLAEQVNPIALLERVQHVYVATSQLGFEALMLGKPVSCFGVPFYAGWGLTDDRVEVPRRRVRRRLEEVFAAAYLHYARYVNPVSGRRCDLETLIDVIQRLRDAGEGASSVEKGQALPAGPRAGFQVG